MSTRLYQIDPTLDPRWADFVLGHAKASVFHSVGWLKSLRSSYDYETVVFTTSPPERALSNGIVFCRIQSWLTGHRLVSLPFSDHCEPLCESAECFSALIQHLRDVPARQNLRYLELRPI